MSFDQFLVDCAEDVINGGSEPDSEIYGFASGDPMFHTHASDPAQRMHWHIGGAEPHTHAVDPHFAEPCRDCGGDRLDYTDSRGYVRASGDLCGACMAEVRDADFALGAS
jgi:hypothetical protein